MFPVRLPFKLVLVIMVHKLFYNVIPSTMNVLQIVITLEIYGVKKIVGIPFGFQGFSDKELTEVPVISCFSGC